MALPQPASRYLVLAVGQEVTSHRSVKEQVSEDLHGV